MIFLRRRLLTALVDYIIFLLSQQQKWSTTSVLWESKHDRKTMFMSSVCFVLFCFPLKTDSRGISCKENKNQPATTKNKIIFLFRGTKDCFQGTLGIFCDAIFIYSNIQWNHKNSIFSWKYLSTSKHVEFVAIFFFKCSVLNHFSGQVICWEKLLPEQFKLHVYFWIWQYSYFWWITQATLRCEYEKWTVWETNRTNWKHWPFPIAIMSSVLVNFGGMSHTTAGLGWRAIGSSGWICRAGKVEELHCM